MEYLYSYENQQARVTNISEASEERFTHTPNRPAKGLADVKEVIIYTITRSENVITFVLNKLILLITNHLISGPRGPLHLEELLELHLMIEAGRVPPTYF